MTKKYEGSKGYDGKYEQQEWAHNCALQALSKVLHQSTGTIAKELVDNKVITKAKDLEDPSAIKKALDHYQFTPQVVMAHGSTWSTLLTQLAGRNGEYFAIWWGNNGTAEDWNDFSNTKSHAFAILVDGSKADLPPTNIENFHLHHPTGAEWVTAWKSPKSKKVTVAPGTCKKDERRISLPTGADLE